MKPLPPDMVAGAMKASNVPLVLVDADDDDQPIVWVNPAFELLTAYTSADLVGRNCRLVQGLETDPVAVETMRTAVQTEKSCRVTVLNYTKNGSPFWNDVRIDAPVQVGQDRRLILGSAGDVSQRHLAEIEHGRFALLHAAVLASLEEGVIIFQADGHIVDANEAASRLTGQSREVLLSGADWWSPLRATTEDGTAITVENSPGAQMMAAGQPVRDVVLRIRDGSGRLRLVLANYQPLPMPTGLPGFGISFRDITAARRAEDELRMLALHDTRTGLANKALLLDHLRLALQRSARDRSLLAVFTVNLDEFRFVNETLGESAADSLLMEMSSRLRAEVRGVDTLARTGADEFVVLAEQLDTPDIISAFAQRFVEVIADPMVVGDTEVAVSASVGIATNASSPPSAETLLRDSAIAMRRAKTRGGGRMAIFEPHLRQHQETRLRTTALLRRAEQRKELTLLYQPIVVLQDASWTAVEALMRWAPTAHQPVSPDVFIPLAERTRQIHTMGRWAMREAASQLTAWRDIPGAQLDGFRVNVNMSVVQLSDPTLPDRVADILDAAQVPAAQISIEVTESVLMGESEQPRVVLHRLRTMGCALVLDDFGTGYSSLSYLHRLPIDVLKIDRSFVGRLGPAADEQPDPDARSAIAIITAVLALARDMRIQVVAEGIETDYQRQALINLGCTLGQGYLFSRPLPGDDIGRLIARAVPRPPTPPS